MASQVSIAPPVEPSEAATDAPATTDGPIAIEKTLAGPPDESSVGFLLVNDTEPSPVDGTAVPMRPDAACGLSWSTFGEYADGDLEILGCEFESEQAATTYLDAWKAAFAEPSPTFYAKPAETAPLDSVPDWLGRTMSISPRTEYEERFVRADLVRQFGSRVYVISSSKPTANPDEVTSQAVALARVQADLIEAEAIIDRPGIGREDESSRIGIRYLAPKWSEMATLGKGDMGGQPVERFWGPGRSADGEIGASSYERQIQSSDVDDTQSLNFVIAAIEVHPTVAAARMKLLYESRGGCPFPTKSAPGTTHAVSCVLPMAYGGGAVSISQNGRVTTVIKTTADGDAHLQQLDGLTAAWEQRLADYGLPMGPGAIDEPAFNDNASLLRAFARAAESLVAGNSVDVDALGDGASGPGSPDGANLEWSTTLTDFNGPSLDWQLLQFESESAAASYRESVADVSMLTPFSGPEGAAEVLGGFDSDAGLIVMQDGRWVQRFASPGRENWGTASGTGEAKPIDEYANWSAAFFRSAGLG